MTLPDCPNRIEGYSVMEAVRHGAFRVLEMELEDLQLLSLGRPGQEAVDMALYDPMPGGSGLLDQIVERWDEVVAEAMAVVDGCPSACERVCVDCLMTFRNMHYHSYLDRHEAAERLRAWGDSVTFLEEIEAELPGDEFDAAPSVEPRDLLDAILAAIGFDEPETDHRIELPGGQGTTTPDFFYPNESGHGVCIYLGEADDDDEQARRWQLDGSGYGLVEIPTNTLSDVDALSRHLVRLAYSLQQNDLAETIKDDRSWYREARDELTASQSTKDASKDPTGSSPRSSDESTDDWEFISQLVGEDWHELAAALRDIGVPAPDDCLQGLTSDGRVTDTRAIFVWNHTDPPLAVVPQDDLDDSASVDADVVTIDDAREPDELASELSSWFD